MRKLVVEPYQEALFQQIREMFVETTSIRIWSYSYVNDLIVDVHLG